MSMILGGEDRRKTVGNERTKGEKKANSKAKEMVWKLTAWAAMVHQLSQCD